MWSAGQPAQQTFANDERARDSDELARLCETNLSRENPGRGCRVKQTCKAEVEQTVEGVRNAEGERRDGTRRNAAAGRCREEGR